MMLAHHDPGLLRDRSSPGGTVETKERTTMGLRETPGEPPGEGQGWHGGASPEEPHEQKRHLQCGGAVRTKPQLGNVLLVGMVSSKKP